MGSVTMAVCASGHSKGLGSYKVSTGWPARGETRELEEIDIFGRGTGRALSLFGGLMRPYPGLGSKPVLSSQSPGSPQ